MFVHGRIRQANVGNDEKATDVGRHGTHIHECADDASDTAGNGRRQPRSEKIIYRVVETTLGGAGGIITAIAEMHEFDEEMGQVKEYKQDGNADKIMCMKSINDEKGLKKYEELDMKPKSRNAGDEQSKMYHDISEDDVVRPG